MYGENDVSSTYVHTYMAKQYLPYWYWYYVIIDGDSCHKTARSQLVQNSYYETRHTTSQDTNETVDKLGMVKISLLVNLHSNAFCAK